MTNFIQKRRVVFLPLLCFILPVLLHAQSYVANNAKILHYNFQTGAQDTEVIELKDLLTQLQRQYHMQFVYDDDVIKGVELPVAVLKERKNELITTLTELLKSKEVKLVSMGNQQYGITKEDLVVANGSEKKITTSKQRHIKGIVKDKLGNPLVGVTVRIKGKPQGTVTNTNGVFELNADPTDSLVISYIGYQSQTISADKGNIELVLLPDQGSLNEVVVVGYGEQRKASVTAAISSISAVDLEKSPVSNIELSLAGRLPGLTVLQRSGEPGTNSVDLYLRGRSTLNNQQPLILVDGVERSFNDLDPYNIASISILKDASATAVYGVRGANGVILVTTKRGESGKNHIDVNINHSLQAPTFLPKMVSAYQYATLSNQVAEQAGQPLPYNDEALQHYKLGDDPIRYPVRNFMNEFTKNFAPQTTVNINVSGGSTKMRYFTSIGYMNQSGLFKTKSDPLRNQFNYNANEEVNRFNFRSNIDIDLTSSLSMYLNVGGYVLRQRDPVILNGFAGTGGTNGYFLLMAKLESTPNLAYNDYTPDGEVEGSTRYAVGGASQTPFGYLNRSGYEISDQNNITSTLGAIENLDFITKGLSIKGDFSYDATAFNTQAHSRNFAVYEANFTGDSITYVKLGSTNNSPLVDQQFQRFNNLYQLDASLNYNRKFENHHVTGMLLFNRIQKVINIELPFNYVGFVGRATYAYKGKYLAEFDAGYNGSEQFAPSHRFGFFPALSLGWVASGEPFLANQSVINFLKLRFSYGRVGNDQMGAARFLYLDNWGSGAGWFTLPAATVQNSIPNKKISWEVSNKADFGIDGDFLNMFEINGDIFYEIRNNILLINNGLIPENMFGQTNLPPINNGKVWNKGFEMELGFHTRIGNKLLLRVKVNGAYNRNKVVYVSEVKLPKGYTYPYRQTGYPLGQMWGYRTAGFFNSRAEINKWADQTSLGAPPQPGDIKYLDLNGDGKIDVKDQAPIGYPNVPEWTFGGSADLNYKQFDLSFLIQGAADMSIYLNDRGVWETEGNFTDWHLQAWTEQKYENHGKITYPRLVPGGNSNQLPSDFWIVNDNYIRLKNVEIGYTFPRRLSRKISASQIRIYVSGFNILTFDHLPIKYFDPESANDLSYPIWKVYNVGVHFSF